MIRVRPYQGAREATHDRQLLRALRLCLLEAVCSDGLTGFVAIADRPSNHSKFGHGQRAVVWSPYSPRKTPGVEVWLGVLRSPAGG